MNSFSLPSQTTQTLKEAEVWVLEESVGISSWV